jgi:3-dehydroquinate synthase
MRLSIPKLHCDIVVSQDPLSSLSDFLSKNSGQYSSVMLLADENVDAAFREKVAKTIPAKDLPTHVLLLPGGEKAKSLENAGRCWEEMHAKGLDRKSLVIGLGGGTISDLAGFVSSTFMRGIDVVFIPTTLLAMVDASIGGKNSINLHSGKNMVGTIHHPRLVVIAPELLKGLPERELRSGMSEIIKAGFIWDADLVDYLERYMSDIMSGDAAKTNTMIPRAVKIKVEIVKADEKEKNLRSLLNYGHTFGHALETITKYATYTHGEAVSIGMSCAAHIGLSLGLIDQNFLQRQDALTVKAGLPIQLPKDIDLNALVALMAADKKAVSGKINLIIPRKVGKVDLIQNVEPELIKKALRLKIERD